VQVTIGDYCTGTNDGAPNQPFCRNGSWVADKYNGATLNMLVADSCGDANSWCRDDPYHLDLAEASLNKFLLNGTPVGDMNPTHWNNRHISWQFIPAPNYTGDIKIGFLAGSKVGWTAVSVSHLPNGMHSLEYNAGGKWTSAPNDGDMGQAYLIQPMVSGETKYEIRVRDASDNLLNNGRVYDFSLPDACSTQCAPAYTQIAYTTSDTPTTFAPATCTASYLTNQSWFGGFTGNVTVTAGPSAIQGWTVKWDLASGQTISSGWNGTFTTSGATVTVTNVNWNGPLKANASTSFGFVANGTPSTPTLSCTAS
jgi:hypothetical protein